ncbi:MAG: hypothetical protein L3J71_08085 [Victivallaceae bacterium]|nr:hypothetical protein [Victivallaceae bacterium]
MNKIIQKLIIGLLMTMPLLVGAATNTTELLAKGDQAYNKFDNITARKYYRQAYNMDPNNYAALLKLTAACNNIGEDSTDKELAKIYFLKAIKFARKLVKKYPKKAEAYFYLAMTYGNLSLYRSGRGKAEAGRNIEKYAKQAIALDPNYSPAYVTLGIYYREVANLGWFTRTIAKTLGGGLPTGTMAMSGRMLEIAVAKAPKTIYPRYQLAVTLEMMKKNSEALAAYRKVLKLAITDHQDAEKQRIAAQKIEELK